MRKEKKGVSLKEVRRKGLEMSKEIQEIVGGKKFRNRKEEQF